MAALAVPGLAGTAQVQDTPGLVTVLASGDVQTRLMGMVPTIQAVSQGASAHILLCGPDCDPALKDVPASASAPQEPHGMSPQGSMRQIVESGTQVEVCAIHLLNKGADHKMLLDGISPADPAVMARAC